MQSLKNGDLIALLGQVAGAGQACGAGANHGNLGSVGFHLLGHGVYVFPIPVGNKTLQAANRHWLALDTTDALALTLGLLGADTAGQSGQRVGGGDDFIGSLEIALLYLLDKFGDADVDRAALHTFGILAAQAALGFLHCHFGGVAQSDFFEVMGTNLRVLLRHGSLGQSHIRHYSFLLLI